MDYQYEAFFSYKRDRESDDWHERVKNKLAFWLKRSRASIGNHTVGACSPGSKCVSAGPLPVQLIVDWPALLEQRTP